jgi:hypothetical protein
VKSLNLTENKESSNLKKYSPYIVGALLLGGAAICGLMLASSFQISLEVSGMGTVAWKTDMEGIVKGQLIIDKGIVIEPIQGAKVTIEKPATVARVAYTDEMGRYKLEDVPVTSMGFTVYEILVEAEGYIPLRLRCVAFPPRTVTQMQLNPALPVMEEIRLKSLSLVSNQEQEIIKALDEVKPGETLVTAQNMVNSTRLLVGILMGAGLALTVLGAVFSFMKKTPIMPIAGGLGVALIFGVLLALGGGQGGGINLLIPLIAVICGGVAVLLSYMGWKGKL